MLTRDKVSAEINKKKALFHFLLYYLRNSVKNTIYYYYNNRFRIISIPIYRFKIYVKQRPIAFEKGNTTTTNMAPQHATITG
jgi:hypothetical protein